MDDIKLNFDDKTNIYKILNDWKDKLNNFERDNNENISIEYLGGTKINLGDTISVDINYN